MACSAKGGCQAHKHVPQQKRGGPPPTKLPTVCVTVTPSVPVKRIRWVYPIPWVQWMMVSKGLSQEYIYSLVICY